MATSQQHGVVQEMETLIASLLDPSSVAALAAVGSVALTTLATHRDHHIAITTGPWLRQDLEARQSEQLRVQEDREHMGAYQKLLDDMYDNGYVTD